MGKPKPGVWWDEQWNAITGCTPCSPGCEHCWAAAMVRRFGHLHGYVVGEDDWSADKVYAPRGFDVIAFHPERLTRPLQWKKPRRIAIEFLGDSFHPDVSDMALLRLVNVMEECNRHRFFFLTKRAQRMMEWSQREARARGTAWPLAHVAFGVTVCTQAEADEKVPLLLQTPAAMRFVHVEPMLGPVGIPALVRLPRPILSELPFSHAAAETGEHLARSNPYGALSVETSEGLLGIKPGEFTFERKVDWVVAGPENHADARPCDPRWIGGIRDACEGWGIPFWDKRAPGPHDRPEGW